MPNRIIKESICTSEKIAQLSDFEFRLWVLLITQADDYGRGDARPAVIKGRVFPFRDRLTIKDIDVALLSLAAKGCVDLYTVDGKPYFLFPTWTEHQRIRDCKPKYPEPVKNDKLPQVAASCGELPLESNPIQSESESNTNTNPKKHNVQSALALFEQLWALFPNKKGKGQVSEAAKMRLVKHGYEQMKRCIDRYLIDLEKDNEWRKPQNGSTFFNSGYVDYLDENYKDGTVLPDDANEQTQDDEEELSDEEWIRMMEESEEP